MVSEVIYYALFLEKSVPHFTFEMFQLWKGFAQRRRTKREREDEMMFIGMITPPGPANPKATPQQTAIKVSVMVKGDHRIQLR